MFDPTNILFEIQCYCDKSTKSCYYRNKHKENIDDALADLQCEPNEELTEPEATAILENPSRLPSGLQCHVGSRIVGGIEAIQHSWPWIVQLQYRYNEKSPYRFHCSGTVVGERMIISAAHCCRIWKKVENLKGVVAEHRKAFKNLNLTPLGARFPDWGKFISF